MILLLNLKSSELDAISYWNNIFNIKNRGTDGVVRGGRVHFNLHRDQFSSDCRTVWDRNLLKCYKAVNFLFDHRMVENWNFGHFWKKFDTFWALGASKLVKKKPEKIEKMMKCFFFIFVCIMFCLLYYVPQTWYKTRNSHFTSLNSQ